MSNAPDFSSAFDLVDDKLADAEKRLAEKRNAATVGKAKADASAEKVKSVESGDLAVMQEPVIEPTKPKLARKAPKKEVAKPEMQLVAKEHRRNLTLKVLEQNERKFNELFYKLQLKGDGRKKQDLADEALHLLFTKYSTVV